MKQLITINQYKKPANKLEVAVAAAVMELQQTLWPNLDQAVFMVYQKFDDAVAAYAGNCTLSRPYAQEDENGLLHMMWIDPYIQIAIYAMREDFSQDNKLIKQLNKNES